MSKDRLSVECLVLAQSFETLWAYYLQSSGQLFWREFRASALTFLEAFQELAVTNLQVKNPVALKIGENTDIEDIVAKLRSWGDGSELYPYPTPQQSRFMLWAFLTGLKVLLINDLGLTRFPKLVMESREADYSESYVKWSGHLPRAVLSKDPNSLVETACNTPTIVVVGDIRRSQDLMTYSPTVEDFSQRMVEFVTRTRESLQKYSGFFDKFTGDGFLAYFNEAVCRATGSDHLECFLGFLSEYLGFVKSHFVDWVRQVKKLPGEPIGLAIGADLGIVSFQNLNYHLVAVGDTIVWASRMASCASANEVVVNNLLFEALRGREGLAFQEREAKTRSGEGFLARVLSLRRQGK